MTKKETIQLIAILNAYYPQMYKDQSEMQKRVAVEAWYEALQQEDFNICKAAVMSIARTEKEHWKINVAMVVEHIKNLTQQDRMTEQQAFNLIRQACSNSMYNSKAEFDKLPLLLQKVVGSPNQLREWSMVESDIFNTVVCSNFSRSYKVAEQRQEYERSLPESVRMLLGGIKLKSLNEVNENE